ELLARLDKRVLAVIEADLRTSIEAGVVRPLDVELTARFFYGGVEKVVLTYLDEGRPVDVGHLSREAALLQLVGTLIHARERSHAPERSPARKRMRPAPSHSPSQPTPIPSSDETRRTR